MVTSNRADQYVASIKENQEIFQRKAQEWPLKSLALPLNLLYI